MSVYGLLLGLQAIRADGKGTTAHVYPASKGGIWVMPGLDGLFARRLPIALTG